VKKRFVAVEVGGICWQVLEIFPEGLRVCVATFYFHWARSAARSYADWLNRRSNEHFY
jgi:hypothetical protein